MLGIHVPVICGVPPGIHWQNAVHLAALQTAPKGNWQYPLRQGAKTFGQSLSSQHSGGGGIGSHAVLPAFAM